MTDHITLRPASGTWVIRAGGAVIGESQNALELIEGDMTPVIYFPKEDVATAFFDPSDTVSACPHKGTATCFHIVTKSNRLDNAAWSYETPQDKLKAIAGYIAFYTSKVTVEQL